MPVLKTMPCDAGRRLKAMQKYAVSVKVAIESRGRGDNGAGLMYF